MSLEGNIVLNQKSMGCNDSVSLMQSHKADQPNKLLVYVKATYFIYSFIIYPCINF